MRNQVRSALGAAATLAVVGGGTAATASIAGGNEAVNHLAGWATIGSVSLAVIGAILATWQAVSRASLDAESDPARVESQFSQVLSREALVKRSHALDPEARGLTVNLRVQKVISPFRDYGAPATGDLGSIAEYFQSLSPRRLVVLGGPGSGKTVLALELQKQLLELSSENPVDPLPVLVNASSYAPGQTWAKWLARHLAQRYSLSGRAADRLVAGGRILPLIDGVDELDRAGAAALVTELNGYLRERELDRSAKQPSMVITCREEEYQDLAGPLDEATHVEIKPLTTGDVRNYLQEIGVGVPDKLDSVLTNPLMLSLADTIYGASANNSQPIDDLLRLPDETAVERQLLASFLANAYRRSGRPTNWSSAQAEGWLALIGNQMRALSSAGYAWRQVTCAMPARLLGQLAGASTCLGLLVTCTVLGIAHHVFGGRTPLGIALVWLVVISVGPAVMAAFLVTGINSGSLLSLPLAIAPFTVAALATPPAAGPLAAGLIGTSSTRSRRELRAELLRQRQESGTRAANPRADLVQSRRRALISAGVVGVTLGVLGGALVLLGARPPRDATIILVCYCMIAIVLCSPWGSFQLARAWFAVRGQLPFRLLAFLDDAHKRGVLRSAGPRFEFRNYAVRGYFSDPARLPAVRQEIGELTEWVLGNLEIRESYRYVGANDSDIEQAVSSLATETILARRPFASDAATQQAVLERVRVRLNELGRMSAFKISLVAREAPGLGAVTDPSRVILTRTMDDLAHHIDRTPAASVGISGIRGIGKSTLIRWLCTERNASHRFPVLGIYVTAPVEYDARDFLVHLYSMLCKAVLADDRFTGRRAHRHQYWLRITSAVIMVTAGIGFGYHDAVDRTAAATWAHHHGDLWTVAASMLIAGALYCLVSIGYDVRRRRSGGRRISIQATARERLQHLRYQVVETTGQTGSLGGRYGLSFSGSRSRQITENQMTLPDLVESYREFAGLAVNVLLESARRDGPLASAQVRLIVGIDEIDRIEDAENAEKFLNDIKAIFGIPNCFYIASLSADALANFERRVVSTRTAFDTTFDTVTRIGPLELGTARQVLERRAIGLPYPFITLCYVLSGGVPRELMRIARSIFDVRNDARFGSEDGKAVPCAVITPQVIAREMESLRQGLMPLATQLGVPGAAELISLLDDPDWPSGVPQDDLVKLAKMTGQRTLFQDGTGSIAAAAKICDGLAAASYFFLSVDELFRTRLDQLIADLRNYDAAGERDAALAKSIHLLARARAAIGVNPAVAITRVRSVRKDYGLSDIAPVLLSQIAPDSTNI
jgi:hypothetical protein